MAEIVAVAVIFLISGILIGLAWHPEKWDRGMAEPTEGGSNPL